jgi:invasion protein IalB
MFLDFNTNALLGSATVDLSTPAEREFNSRDKASNRWYIDAKFNYLAAHHWFECISAQQADPTHNRALAESLHHDWVRASKHAANQVKKKPRCPFSHQLIAAQKKKNVLQRIVSQTTLHVNYSASIAQFSRHGYNFLIPTSLLVCRQELSKAQAEI